MLPSRRNAAKSFSGICHSQSSISFARPAATNASTSRCTASAGMPAASSRRCSVSGARICEVQLWANHRSNAPPWYVQPCR